MGKGRGKGKGKNRGESRQSKKQQSLKLDDGLLEHKEGVHVGGAAGQEITVQVPTVPRLRPTTKPPTATPTAKPTAPPTARPTSTPSASPTTAPSALDYACEQCMRWERPCKGRGNSCEMLGRTGACSPQTCNCLESPVCAPPR
jgi:hypothetical protein